MKSTQLQFEIRRFRSVRDRVYKVFAFDQPHFYLAAATVVMLYAAFMHLRLLLAYPPGTDLDVGYNGLEALKPLRYGIWPFFIVKMSSPDFLFIYMQSLSSFVFGERIIALRLPSVFNGWLGFAVLYAAIKELGRSELDRVTRQRIGLLAVAALASSQVLAFLHRMGLRSGLFCWRSASIDPNNG